MTFKLSGFNTSLMRYSHEWWPVRIWKEMSPGSVRDLRASQAAHTRQHVDGCVATTWMSYRCVQCHPWCTHRTSLVVKKMRFQFSCGCEKFHYGRSFGFLVINICNHGEHYETPCIKFVCSIRELVHPMRGLQFRGSFNGSYQENVKFIVFAVATYTWHSLIWSVIKANVFIIVRMKPSVYESCEFITLWTL
jgi:hypothetical protein